MMKTLLQLMATLTIFMALSAAADDNVIHKDINEDSSDSGTDTGYFQNCGSAIFNGSWTPKTISYKTPVTVTVHYILPYDMSGGSYNISLYFHGDPDPFFEYDGNISSAEIKKYLPLSYPAKKGKIIKTTYKITDVENLSSYPGDYDAKLRVFNEKKQEMLCVKMHAVVTL